MCKGPRTKGVGGCYKWVTLQTTQGSAARLPVCSTSYPRVLTAQGSVLELELGGVAEGPHFGGCGSNIQRPHQVLVRRIQRHTPEIASWLATQLQPAVQDKILKPRSTIPTPNSSSPDSGKTLTRPTMC